MNPKLKKALFIFGPLVVGVGIILWVNRKKKPTTQEISEQETADTIPMKSTPKITVTPPEFPIGVGSRGEKVKEIQRAIGVTADGVFGPKTEAALLSKMGVKSITNQSQFDKLKKLATGQSNLSRAQFLIATFNKGGVSMFVISTTDATQVNIDAFGAIQFSNRDITLPGNKLYNNQDYKPFVAAKGGDLIFEITRGDFKGTYAIDPNFVTLK